MSFLDMDERLIELAAKIELVYSPIADVKEFPADVDVTLVEGAVSNDENEHMARTIRRNSRFIVSFGDCATAGNVTAMRNKYPREALLRRAYVELARGDVPTLPDDPNLAKLLVRAKPLHEVVPVDLFLHGCPPSPEEIWLAVSALVEGRVPELPAVYQRYG
jgi:NAD-reducing hydrogenase small subunit